MKKKLVLFGGLGFIGKNLIEMLEAKYLIIVVDKKDDELYLNSKKVKFFKFDFFNDELEKLKELINKEKPSFVINLISIVTADRNLTTFNLMIESNLKVLLDLYNIFKDKDWLEFFINFGSAEEYGNIKSPFKEDMREAPISPYAIAKQLTTNTAIMLNKNEKFPIMVVRPTNLFGKYQAKEKFIPYIVNCLKNGEKIQTTFGEQRRNFISAKTFSYIILKILENYKNYIGEIINIGTEETYSLKEIIEYLRKHTNSNSDINYGSLPYRKNEVMNFEVDLTKLNKKIIINENFYKELENLI